MSGAPQGSARRGILLEGLRGTGKTTIGKLLASRLGWRFVDIDRAAAHLLGVRDAAQAFAEHGEQVWRDAEARALEAELNRKSATPTVISLGGGVPCQPAGRAALESARKNGWIIGWLDADEATLVQRLQRSPTRRPSLTGLPLREEVAHLKHTRRIDYERLADFRVDVGDLPVEDLVEVFVSRLAVGD